MLTQRRFITIEPRPFKDLLFEPPFYNDVITIWKSPKTNKYNDLSASGINSQHIENEDGTFLS